MVNRLPGGRADVDADVETVRLIAFPDDGCHVAEHLPACGLLTGAKIEICSAVPPGDYQQVPGIYRVLVENGECGIGFEEKFSVGIGMAEGAGSIVLSWWQLA